MTSVTNITSVANNPMQAPASAYIQPGTALNLEKIKNIGAPRVKNGPLTYKNPTLSTDKWKTPKCVDWLIASPILQERQVAMKERASPCIVCILVGVGWRMKLSLVGEIAWR